MKTKTWLAFLFLVAFLAFPFASYAHGPAGVPSQGATLGATLKNTYQMMGGHGGGMSGGHGGGMMEGGMARYGEWISRLLDSFSNRFKKPDPQNDQEIERLKREVREKRQEISSLFHSDNPDRKLIDQKITELNHLENELDERLNH